MTLLSAQLKSKNLHCFCHFRSVWESIVPCISINGRLRVKETVYATYLRFNLFPLINGPVNVDLLYSYF